MQRLLEKLLGRVLQRICCLKHVIEVLWHRYFKLVDGETSGPTTLTGPIGQTIQDNQFYLEDVVDFKPVDGGNVPDLPEEVVKDMASDQAYAYRIFKAVSVGSKYFVENDVSLRT